MKRAGWLVIFLLMRITVSAQSLPQRMRQAVSRLKADSQMRHAILGLYLVDAETGEVLVNEQGETGLAPASCQKLFTSIAALAKLGPGFQYKTVLGYRGKITGKYLAGDLCLVGEGDPSLGSWRYASTDKNRQFS
nr:D-alanyl-D-alanine carboxypeptidase [Sediminibacterium sp.]